MSGGAPVPRPNILLGVTRLARGRADGLAQFGDTPQAFLASLAPLIAFPLVGALLTFAHGQAVEAVSELLATFCALLAPPVLSNLLARLWGREEFWLRFATAFNWCQWAIPAVAAALLFVVGALMQAGLPNETAALVLMLGLSGYGLWLHWFIVKHGLRLSGARSALVVLLVNLGTTALVLGPRLVGLVTGLAIGPAP